MPSSTTKITAQNYNDIQENVHSILGNTTSNSPQTGYGNLVISDQWVPVPGEDKITAQMYEDLYIDIVRTRIHQVGAENFTIDPFVIGDKENNVNAQKIDLNYLLGLEGLVAAMETDKHLVHSSQVEEVLYFTETRTSGWNQQIVHEFKLTWDDADHRRHYFNAGGKIRISAELAGDASSKGSDWASVLDYGSLDFAFNDTFQIEGATTTGLGKWGNYNMPSSSYSLLFNAYAAAYSPNLYTIEAADVDNTSIKFRITFDDANSGFGSGGADIDEPVLGTTSSQISAIKPWGEVDINGTMRDTVKVNEPTYTVLTNLSSGS